MSDSGEFLAAIVPQMGGGKKGMLSNNAATVIEKYKHPKIENVKGQDRGDSMMAEVVDKEELAEGEVGKKILKDKFGNYPMVSITGEQLESLIGKNIGDEFCLCVDVKVESYLYQNSTTGAEEYRYELKLISGMIEEEVD